MQREEYLTKKKEESDVQKEFDKRVAENREKEDAKTAKKRLKRQKRKANKKKPKQEVVESSEDSDVEEEITNTDVKIDDCKTDKVDNDPGDIKESLSDKQNDETEETESAVDDSFDAEK